jgi:hypothetical protein
MRLYTPVGAVVPGLLICCLLVWGGCSRTNRSVALPSGYRVTMPEASQTLRMRPLPLTVQVTDAEGAPVNEVPVQFRLPQVSPAAAEIEPPTVVTRDGKATAIFRSRSAGRFGIEITVAGYTETVDVTVLGDSPRF